MLNSLCSIRFKYDVNDKVAALEADEAGSASRWTGVGLGYPTIADQINKKNY